MNSNSLTKSEGGISSLILGKMSGCGPPFRDELIGPLETAFDYMIVSDDLQAKPGGA